MSRIPDILADFHDHIGPGNGCGTTSNGTTRQSAARPSRTPPWWSTTPRVYGAGEVGRIGTMIRAELAETYDEELGYAIGRAAFTLHLHRKHAHRPRDGELPVLPGRLTNRATVGRMGNLPPRLSFSGHPTLEIASWPPIGSAPQKPQSASGGRIDRLKWARTGLIGHTRIGRALWVNASDIEALRSSNAVPRRVAHEVTPAREGAVVGADWRELDLWKRAR